MLLYNLPPYTNHITYHHLELSYQFVLPSRHSPGIFPRFPFNFPSITFNPPPSCLEPTLVALFRIYYMVLSLPCVHIHLLSSDRERHLWSSKRFRVYVYLSSEDLFIFFGKSSLLLFLFCYLNFGTYLSTSSQRKFKLFYFSSSKSFLDNC